MSSLAELRKSIAEAITGVGDPPLIGYPYPPGSPVVPAGVVEPEDVDFVGRGVATFDRGGEGWTLTVTLLIAAADEESSAAQADTFFDRSSNDLKDAIEGIDPNHVTVTGADRWGQYGPYDNGVLYAGLRLNIQVLN